MDQLNIITTYFNGYIEKDIMCMILLIPTLLETKTHALINYSDFF